MTYMYILSHNNVLCTASSTTIDVNVHVTLEDLRREVHAVVHGPGGNYTFASIYIQKVALPGN